MKFSDSSILYHTIPKTLAIFEIFCVAIELSLCFFGVKMFYILLITEAKKKELINE